MNNFGTLVRFELKKILGKKITKDAKMGTPMSWDLVDMQ